MIYYEIKIIPQEIVYENNIPWFPFEDKVELSFWENNQIHIYEFQTFNFVYSKLKEFIPTEFVALFEKEQKQSFGKGIEDKFIIEYLGHKFRLESIQIK